MFHTHLVPPLPACHPPLSRSKRQPKPSVHAPSIRNFKEQQQKQLRKHRNSCNIQEQTHWENTPPGTADNGPIRCILPSGKKLNLSIIIRKKHPKAPRKRVAFQKPSPKGPHSVVLQSQKRQSESPDLLSKFLMVAQQLKKMDKESPSKVEPEGASQNKSGDFRGRRWGENERSLRLWERGRQLGEKCENMLKSMIYL